MRIHVVNPNTTRSMTLKIGAAAKAAASPGVEVSAVNPEFGPPSIEGYFDEAFSLPGLIEEIGKAANADAFVIACFDDTGLEAARCATGAPVVSIGEAAFHMASLIADKFSVVTTLSRSIAPIEHNLAKYGLKWRCARVRAADAPVLALEDSELRRTAPHRKGDRARARGGRRLGDRARLRRHDRSRGADPRAEGRSPGARRGRLRGEPRRKPGPAGLEDIEAQHLCAAPRQGLRRRIRPVLAGVKVGEWRVANSE